MAAPHVARRIPVLAWLTVAGGAAIVLFWTAWFTGLSDLGQSHPVKSGFEVAFPVADGLLAITLFATGVLLARGRRAPAAFALVAAAAQTLFLGLLDTTFNLAHGFYHPFGADAAVTAGINLACVAGGVAGLAAAWRLWRSA
jgi:hypothetical protein